RKPRRRRLVAGAAAVAARVAPRGATTARPAPACVARPEPRARSASGRVPVASGTSASVAGRARHGPSLTGLSRTVLARQDRTLLLPFDRKSSSRLGMRLGRPQLFNAVAGRVGAVFHQGAQ